MITNIINFSTFFFFVNKMSLKQLKHVLNILHPLSFVQLKDFEDTVFADNCFTVLQFFLSNGYKLVPNVTPLQLQNDVYFFLKNQNLIELLQLFNQLPIELIFKILTNLNVDFLLALLVSNLNSNLNSILMEILEKKTGLEFNQFCKKLEKQVEEKLQIHNCFFTK